MGKLVANLGNMVENEGAEQPGSAIEQFSIALT
jgi:hypothetical protein